MQEVCRPHWCGPGARCHDPAVIARTSNRRRLFQAALISAAIGAAACTDPRPGGELLVSAASDLAAAMPELAAAFERETGVAVLATLGSSGLLAQQILQGAPVDVYLSADEPWVDRLEQAGRLEPGTRAVYAYGVLAIVAGRVAAPADAGSLAGAGFARIAIANPEHAPYGRAAHQVLARSGILDAVRPRLVLAENVRQAVHFAENRAVDAAIAALPLMDSARHRWTPVPTSLHDPLVQTAAAVAGRPRSDEAAAFIAFLTGEAGRAILARHRFGLP
jgi:molybdate transport system substrate-binding protein